MTDRLVACSSEPVEYLCRKKHNSKRLVRMVHDNAALCSIVILLHVHILNSGRFLLTFLGDERFDYSNGGIGEYASYSRSTGGQSCSIHEH